jgi:hypothetical protein
LFEFKAKWEYWQKKCIQVLTNENFASEPTGTLEIICKVNFESIKKNKTLINKN